MHELEQRPAERARLEAELTAVRERLATLREGLSQDDGARLAARIFREVETKGAHFGEDLVERAWLMGVTVAINTMAGRRVCRICGCWQEEACPPTCSWVADDLCSACEGPR